MLIDWFTVGAQVLNFVILVWLLKKFLYKPVLDAIDARESLIAKQIADANAVQATAQAQCESFLQKSTDFDKDRAALLAKAQEDAKAQSIRLMDAARKTADDLKAKQLAAQHEAAASLSHSLGERLRSEVFAIARQTLVELAGADLEVRTTEVFVSHLHTLDGATKAELEAAFKTTGSCAVLRSAFDLPVVQRAVIQDAVNGVFATSITLQFETTADLVGGIELVVGGQKLAWTIAQHLESLQSAVTKLLNPADPVQAPASVAEKSPATAP